MPTDDSASPSVLTQTRKNRKTTASKALLSTSKTIEDHATGAGIKTDVNSLPTARKTLTTHGLNLPTAGNTLIAISAALFEFGAMANLGATHTDIIRALAYVIYEAQKDINIEHVTDKVKALLGGPVATLDEKVDQLEDVIVKHRREMEKTVTEVRENIQSSMVELVKAVKDASTHNTHPHNAPTETQRSDGSRSYAAAARANTPPLLTKVLAKSEAQSRQILIDRRSPFHANSLKDLTEAQLVAKATLAIELLTKDEVATPQGLTFLSARRLPHGGVLYELNSTESAV
ncbi:hypothetical protein CY34DRAFT_781156, partial [Suillus luteus UH-Slu-Lm8-n1]